MPRLYVYPPRFVNGTLYASNDETEYIQGKIIQIISIVRGELVSDAFVGVPFQLFSSTTDINSDAARLESILEDYIEECDFDVSAEYIENGIFQMNVNWSFQGTENSEVFLIGVDTTNI